MKHWRLLLPLLLVCLIGPRLGADGAAPPAPDVVELVFLHVNDIHGQIDGTGSGGGYARLATLVGQIRAAATQPAGGAATQPARVFLLDCGDISSRGDNLTTRTRAAANIAIMNRLRFDAFVPGNGEFYMPVGELQRRVDEAGFPVLAANVKLKADDKPFAQPYVILPAGPVKVALLGLCYVRTEIPWTGFTQDDPIQTARRLVPQLRKQADLVVAMTHIGIAADTSLVRQVAGIDLVLGGHSHTLLSKGRVVRDPDGRDVTICQAGEHLSHLGKATVRMKRSADVAGWQVQAVMAEVIPLDAKVASDSQMLKFIEELKRDAAAVSRPAAAE